MFIFILSTIYVKPIRFLKLLSKYLSKIPKNFRQKTKQPTVQMVQCSETSNQPTTTLKSLKDPNLLIDNMSVRSQR